VAGHISAAAFRDFVLSKHSEKKLEGEMSKMATAVTQEQFNAAYWASQPMEIQTLHNSGNPALNLTAEYGRLATTGFVIDKTIMIDGMDPWKVMNLRAFYGFTWVPNALQPPVQLAPGLGMPGAVTYDARNPPPGSIKVSTDLADYPPFLKPVPVPGPSTTPIVGVQSWGNIYLTVPGDTSPGGTVFTDSRGTFVKRVVNAIFGQSSYWELLGASPAPSTLPTVPDAMAK
jgi:hypothetical protein